MDIDSLRAALDLSEFSAAECSRIWEVLQKDFQLRYEETKRLDRLQTRVAHASEKVQLLSDVENFNDRYCIVCFENFIFLINPSFECQVCTCNVCRRCSRQVARFRRRLCRLCEEEKDLLAQRCSWFYNNARKTFVVNNNPTPLLPQAADDLAGADPLTAHMRRYLADFVTRYKSGEAAGGDQGPGQANGEAAARDATDVVPTGTPMAAGQGRSETEEALNRMTGMQVMRFQQRINAVATETRAFLRAHVRYEIPEPGVDRQYDLKVSGFTNDVINVLRNFSQTLYIAIEGYHSRTGLPLRNVHQEVHQILQDEVENLVGYRVDVRHDDEVASTVSDEEAASSVYGPTQIQERLSQILIEKWLADHQTFLDDQRLTASDLYTHSALENFLAKKGQDREFGEMSLDDGPDGCNAEEDVIVGNRAVSAFNAPSGGLNEVDPDLLTLRDGRQLGSSFGDSSSGGGTGNWLLKGRPNVSGSYGEALHHFSDTPSPRVGVRATVELSDELSAEEEGGDSSAGLSDDADSLSAIEREHLRKKSTASMDFDDVYTQNLTLYSDSSPERARGSRSGRSEDSGVQVNGKEGPPGASGRERKVSLGFMRMDWSFSERSDPCFVSKTTEVTGRAAECATISVEVDGTMPIDVYWYRVSSDELVQLEEDDRVEFVAAEDHPGKHTLHVWHLVAADAGEYLAVAVNEKGSNKQGFKISVLPNEQPLRAPEFQKELTDDEVRPGDTARLRCKVVGYPAPRVVFLRGAAPLANSDKHQIMHIGDRSFTLSVHDVQPSDEGAYTCVATNAAGSVRSAASVGISSAQPLVQWEDEALVDTSPAVRVRQQVERLGQDEAPGAGQTLILDQVEPLRKPSIGDIKLDAAGSWAPPARKNSPGAWSAKEAAPPARKSSPAAWSAKEAAPPARKSSPAATHATETPEADSGPAPGFLVADADAVIDCGLKRVDSRYRRDFHVNRESGVDRTDGAAAAGQPRRVELRPSATKQQQQQQAPPSPRSDASRRISDGIAEVRQLRNLMAQPPERREEEEKEERKPRHERPTVNWSLPVVADQKSPGSPRRGSVDYEEAFSAIKDRFEQGFSRPVPKNLYASFRTRKFPSVAEIKTQFSSPVRGSYLKREVSPAAAVTKSSSLPRGSTQPVVFPKPIPASDKTFRSSARVDLNGRAATLPRAGEKSEAPEFWRVKLKPTGRTMDD